MNKASLAFCILGVPYISANIYCKSRNQYRCVVISEAPSTKWLIGNLCAYVDDSLESGRSMSNALKISKFSFNLRVLVFLDKPYNKRTLFI